MEVESNKRKMQTHDNIGLWERHTKGIGSKLMNKMGYVVGKGLGRNSDGRPVPLRVEFLPQGMSLDKVMETRSKKPDAFMSRPKPKDIQLPAQKSKRPKLIRKTITIVTNQSACAETKLSPDSKKEVQFLTTRDLAKMSEKDIALTLLQTGEELDDINFEFYKLKDTLERSIEKGDQAVVQTVKRKIDELQIYRDQLRKSEKFLKNQSSSNTALKKLLKF